MIHTAGPVKHQEHSTLLRQEEEKKKEEKNCAPQQYSGIQFASWKNAYVEKTDLAEEHFVSVGIVFPLLEDTSGLYPRQPVFSRARTL
jgi:hypothetical protein